MKTIIAGCRNIDNEILVWGVIKQSGIRITEVVSGGAKGVDKLGEDWANFIKVPVKLFPAQWDKYGKVAGPMRNEKMAEYADALIAIWDGKSSGTRNMINTAITNRLKIIHIHITGDHNDWKRH
jgi:hypothetical protein